MIVYIFFMVQATGDRTIAKTFVKIKCFFNTLYPLGYLLSWQPCLLQLEFLLYTPLSYFDRLVT